uniref:Uncharacterized protein n=1 Tax=Arundo donax TaxID=35708 RepID=A0A0A9BEZ2_ARUDO
MRPALTHSTFLSLRRFVKLGHGPPLLLACLRPAPSAWPSSLLSAGGEIRHCQRWIG